MVSKYDDYFARHCTLKIEYFLAGGGYRAESRVAHFAPSGRIAYGVGLQGEDTAQERPSAILIKCSNLKICYFVRFTGRITADTTQGRFALCSFLCVHVLLSENRMFYFRMA